MPSAQHNAFIVTIAIQMYRNLNVFTKSDDCLLHAGHIYIFTTVDSIFKRIMANEGEQSRCLTESLYVLETTVILQREKRKRRKVKSTNVIGRLSFHGGEV